MQQLTGLDQMFLSLDSPTTNAVLGGLVMFDAPHEGQPVPDEPFMRQRLSERFELIPPLHTRLAKVPFGIDHSYLVDAGRIDVAAHLRTLMLPHPGTREQLAEEISRIMSTAMDVERPMWDYTVIEGLEGGGIAHVLRIHHGVVDGSTMPVLWDLQADEPTAGLEHPPRSSWHEPLGGGAELFMRGVLNTWTWPVRMAALQARTAWYLAGRVRAEGPTAVPALAGQLLPGPAGLPIANLVNRRRRVAGGPEVTPYLPTLVPPRTPPGGRLSHRRHFVYSD